MSGPKPTRPHRFTICLTAEEKDALLALRESDDLKFAPSQSEMIGSLILAESEPAMEIQRMRDRLVEVAIMAARLGSDASRMRGLALD